VNGNEDKLMADLASAKPVHEPDGQDWAESERAEQVLARVREATQPDQKPRARRWSSPTRMAALLAVVAVVAVVAFVAIYVAGGQGAEQTAGTATSQVGEPSSGEEAVSMQKALERVIALAYSRPGATSLERPGETDLVEEARSLGIVGPDEDLGPSLLDAVSRVTYALWLWRVFGSLLPDGATTRFVDVEGLAEESRQAILGLASAGVLPGYEDGTFRPDRPLSRSEEAASEAKIADLLD
jgi:S-layer homology domain